MHGVTYSLHYTCKNILHALVFAPRHPHMIWVLLCCVYLSAALADEPAHNSSEATFLSLQKEKGFSFYYHNKVSLLPTCQIKYDSLLADISRARHYVHLDYFRFQKDSVTTALFDMLKRKAAEGVEVRVVFDAFANRNGAKPLKNRYIRQLRRSGVKIYAFDRLRFPWVNHLLHRNHHKVAVIDGKCVYSGGMNVADYYLHGKPRIGEWRDMHFRAAGDMVDGYEKVFADMWYAVSKERLDSAKYAAHVDEDDSMLVAVTQRVPRVTPAVMRRLYCVAIDNARDSIQIVNPYPCLFGEVKNSLYRALERGVKVHVMVSVESDGRANGDVTALEMKKLADRGAYVWYCSGSFHHSKIMMVDGLFCTIGTANLDGRSLSYDYEVNSVFFDVQLTRQLQDIFEKDRAEDCRLLTRDYWRDLCPPRRRIRAGVFSIIKKMM